jgi:hypothetical protein
MKIEIDAEFRDLIPPLAGEEREQLKENLKAEGCRDAVVVWKGRGVLVDGHNRFDICNELGIGFQVKEKDFSDRDAVIRWMVSNQLARRNLAPAQRTLLLGRLYKEQKKMVGRPEEKSGHNVPIKSNAPTTKFKHETAEKLAAKHGIDEKTVRRAEKVVDAVETLKKVDPELRQKMMKGEGPTQKAIVSAAEILEACPEAQDEAKAVLAGAPKAKPPVVRDRFGVPVEGAELQAAFGLAAEVKSLAHQISLLPAKFAAICQTPVGKLSARHRQEFESTAKNLRNIVAFSEPYAVCCYCGGPGCKSCLKAGFLNLTMWRSAPVDMRTVFLKGHKCELTAEAVRRD